MIKYLLDETESCSQTETLAKGERLSLEALIWWRAQQDNRPTWQVETILLARFDVTCLEMILSSDYERALEFLVRWKEGFES